jgi:glucose/arabinose dehydrogenase
MAPPGFPYAIPPMNPFVSNASCFAAPQNLPCPEVWAYGFRNPWRFGVDPITRDLWVGDVGQDTLEEIDFVVAGGNYGWNCLEGTANYEFVPPCDMPLFQSPEVVHGRSEAQSIVGGPVYRGTDVPQLAGYLIYGDFVTGNVWALDTRTAAPPIQLSVPTHAVSAFGQDADGEVYLVTFDSPSIYKLAPP